MCAIVFLDIGRFSILVYRIIHLALPGILIHYILHKNNTRIRYAWMAVVISHNNTGSLKKHTDQVIIKQTESSHVAYISRFISCARVFWENINCFSLSDFLDNFKLLFSPFFSNNCIYLFIGAREQYCVLSVHHTWSQFNQTETSKHFIMQCFHLWNG